MSNNSNQFFSWLSTTLKDKNWQIAKSGFKLSTFNNNQQISTESGFWNNPTYATSKPPRWIINFNVDNNGVTASVPSKNKADRIGQANTAQGNVVGIAIRIVPVFNLPDGTYRHELSWEWNLLFLTPYPLPQGSSSESFGYDVVTGGLTYKEQNVNYMYAALLMVVDPNEEIIVGANTITYGETTQALKELLHVSILGSEPDIVDTYDLFTESSNDINELKRVITLKMDNAPSPPNIRSTPTPVDAQEDDEPTELILEIEEDKDLIGVEKSVYRQINAALKSGKQHLMLYGPPGTGKTTLARWIATKLSGNKWNLITGSADWSSQDIIGGYQPIGSSEVAFMPGILLKNFNHPLIIDELNRCDIDKVLGPLFTVLSGHHTTLPYRIEINNPESKEYVILPTFKSSKEDNEFAPGKKWRIISTINSIDKASLYQMSYALSRRFGWIYVDAPKDKKAFLSQYLRQSHGQDNVEDELPIAKIWELVNHVRVLGAAPFVDMVKGIFAMDPSANLFIKASESMKEFLLDAFDMFVLPLLDGIIRHDAENLAKDISVYLELDDDASIRLHERILNLAI